MCFTLNTKWIINEHSGYKRKSIICLRWIKGNHKLDRVLFCNRSEPREVLDLCVLTCSVRSSPTHWLSPCCHRTASASSKPLWKEMSLSPETRWEHRRETSRLTFPRLGGTRHSKDPNPSLLLGGALSRLGESLFPLAVTSAPPHNCSSDRWSSKGTRTSARAVQVKSPA